MTATSRLRSAALTIAVVVAVEQRGHAQEAMPPEDVRPVEARKACLVGEVDKGVALLADYFAATEDATALYNMARCYEQNGQDAKAIPRFREYLRKAGELSQQERQEIERRIGELEALAAKPVAPPVRLPAPRPDVVVSRSPPSESGGRPVLRRTGLAVGGAGLVALGAGFVFALRLDGINDDLAAERSKSSPEALRYRQLLDDGRSARTLQWVFLGVGAAAIIGGAASYYLGLPRSEKQVSLTPWFGKHAAGGHLAVIF